MVNCSSDNLECLQMPRMISLQKCFPLLATGIFVSMCSISFPFAIIFKVVYGLPYISDTITTRPSSAYFAFMLNIYSFFLFLTVWAIYTSKPERNCKDKLAFSLGLASALGACIVANFNETVVFPIHVAGSFLAFGGAFLYSVMMVVTSKKFRSLRVICALGIGSSLAVTLTFGAIALSLFKGKDMLNWREDDGGFEQRIVSVIGEYIVAVFVHIFLLTLRADIQYDEEESPLLSA